MRTFIVLPTYNERENLENLVKEIFSLSIDDLNIIVIDDNSPDGTGKIADELSKKYPLKVIHRPRKLGLGSAYITGFKKALKEGADLIFEMDSDFSHNPKKIIDFLKEAKRGYKVIIGSRRIPGGNVKGWNLLRNLESKAAMTVAQKILNLKTYDVTSGFRCYKRKVLESLNLEQIKSNGYAFQVEMIWYMEKKKFTIKEIPITFIDRKHGRSKLSFKDVLEFFLTIIRLRFKLI